MIKLWGSQSVYSIIHELVLRLHRSLAIQNRPQSTVKKIERKMKVNA